MKNTIPTLKLFRSSRSFSAFGKCVGNKRSIWYSIQNFFILLLHQKKVKIYEQSLFGQIFNDDHDDDDVVMLMVIYVLNFIFNFVRLIDVLFNHLEIYY